MMLKQCGILQECTEGTVCVSMLLEAGGGRQLQCDRWSMCGTSERNSAAAALTFLVVADGPGSGD